jgi:hypothetical protein
MTIRMPKLTVTISILLAIAIEIIEGIASALYPEIQVTKEALPLVLQAELMHRLPKFSLW